MCGLRMLAAKNSRKRIEARSPAAATSAGQRRRADKGRAGSFLFRLRSSCASFLIQSVHYGENLFFSFSLDSLDLPAWMNSTRTVRPGFLCSQAIRTRAVAWIEARAIINSPV